MNKRKKLLTKKKLARHLFSLTLAVILMGGCITPAYYSHEQEIELTVPRGATAELDGKPLEKKGDKVRTTVERSWRDKEIIVKKEGYQDATVKLDSVPTDDKWGRTLWGGEDSGAVMLVPIHSLLVAGAAAGVPLATIGYTVEVAGRGKPLTGVFEGALMGAAGALSVMTVAPVGVAMDAFNIFVGIPSTILLNPWKEYKYDRSPVKMVPVEQPAPTP